MCTRFLILTTLLAALATPALGQQPPRLPSGTLDLGFRLTDISGDEARFQRFRDIGDGAFLERFKVEREGGRWLLNASADHVGRLDQRYTAEFHHTGRLKIGFQWDQVPLFYSRDTRSLFSSEGGVLRVADDIQQDIQSGRVTLANVIGQTRGFDMKSRRDVAQFNLLFSPRRDVDVTFDLTNTLRDGTQPWGTTLAGFSNVNELPAPVDSRTTDLATGVAWVGRHGSLRAGYDGSWYNNNASTLVWDNPLVFASPTLSPQGRLALWPDNTVHSLTTTGGLKLPARSHASASVTVGTWRQDEALLPFTINPNLPVLPLDRPTAEGEVRTLAMSYNVTSRPSRYVWLNARFRYYDFDNRTPEFHLTQRVTYDTNVGASPVPETEIFSYTRHNFDADASFTPLPFSAIRVGYGRDWTDRTHRIFERTTEDTIRASLDSTAPSWLTLRAIVERSTRTGAGFDEAALTGIGEQAAMRHYDIADRDRNRVTGLVQVSPNAIIGLSASAAVGHDDYRNSGFGLRDSKSRQYSTTVDVTPGEAVAAGLTYLYERYTALQNSRTASPGPQTTDPTRDWATDSADKVHTTTANFDLLRLPRRSELRLSYDFTRSRATYVYVLPANTTLAAPQQLPPILNELETATADFRIAMTDQLSIGATYWYDRYDVDDFALGPGTIDRLDQPGTVLMGYVYRPYTANSGWVRLIVSWR